MATFQNDLGDSLEIKYVDEVIEPGIEKASSLTSGSRSKEQVAGERLKMAGKARATVAEMRSLLDLLKNPRARYFFYTPEEDHPIYTGLEKPFAARIYNVKSQWDNRSVHYIKFNVQSVELI